MPQKSDKLRPKPEGLAYTNRMGDTYFLHEGKTKTGKVRYFVAKQPRDGALTTMPEGFEFSESINAVVSVRKIQASEPKIPADDIALVQAEMNHHSHLRDHRVDTIKDEIVIFEPENYQLGLDTNRVPDWFEIAFRNESRMNRRIRYNPVMKFVPTKKKTEYRAHRMTYRGHGGWSWEIESGPLPKVVKKLIRHIGKESFFELL